MSPSQLRPHAVAAGPAGDVSAAVPALSRRGFLGLAAAGLVAGCATAPAALYPATPVAIDAAAAAALVSGYRRRNGLNAVTLSPRLMQAAQAQALAMAQAGRMSHAFTAADTLPRRLDRVGYDWGVSAENIGAGYTTLEAAFRGWVGSPHHNENLLRRGITEIGIAAASSPSRYRFFWALILSTPRRHPQRMSQSASFAGWMPL
ncbi:CAP domain-containing protein [Pseudoxanthobacter sp.]|uniref:CAP domain-containing protein n=1 Tax=Pseudoxanthobacter sp. TaxID=1925742 RepID=UPI002FE092D1